MPKITSVLRRYHGCIAEVEILGENRGSCELLQQQKEDGLFGFVQRGKRVFADFVGRRCNSFKEIPAPRRGLEQDAALVIRIRRTGQKIFGAQAVNHTFDGRTVHRRGAAQCVLRNCSKLTEFGQRGKLGGGQIRDGFREN